MRRAHFLVVASVVAIFPCSAALPDDAKKPDEAKKADAGQPLKPEAVLEGHDADVYCIRFSPDGSKLATASFDKTVKLWDAHMGKEIASLNGHQGKVLTLAFSADGRSLLSGSEDKTLKLWDVPGEGAAELAGHSGAVNALALSPDGNFAATASADGTVRLWNCASHKEALKLEGSGGPVRCLAFSSDGKKIASGGEDKTVRLWDVSSVTAPAPAAASSRDVALLAQGATWTYHKGSSEPPADWKAVAFDDSKWAKGPSGFGYSSTPEELATVGTKLDDMMNNYLSVYVRGKFKVEDPKKLEKLSLHVLVDDGMVAYLNGEEIGRDNIEGSPPAHDKVASSSHEALAVDIDLTPQIAKLAAGDNVIAVQGHNHELESSDLVLTPTLTAVFKAEEKKEAPAPKFDLAKLEGPGGTVLSVAWSGDSSQVAAGCEDKSIRVWKVGSAESKAIDQGAPVHGVAFLDEKRVVAAGDGPIKIWTIESGAVEKTLEGHQGAVGCLAVRPDRKQLLSGGADGTVRLWSVDEAKELKSFSGHEGAVEAVAFGREAGTVASGGADGSIRAWNVEGGKESRRFAQGSAVRTVACGPSERYYSAGSGNNAFEWRTVSVEAVRTFTGHGGSVHATAFSPDGATVASASGDKTVKLWNRGDGKEIRSINAHDSSVYCIAFNKDGSLLASGGFDRSVKLWKPADGTLVKKLDGHGEGVFCLKFSADGQFLYSGSSDRTIRKWKVEDGSAAGVLEGHPGWVCGVAVFPGDAKLASVDYGGNIIVWNLADGKIASQRKLGAVVYDLALSPDGKRIATANLNGKAFIVPAE